VVVDLDYLDDFVTDGGFETDGGGVVELLHHSDVGNEEEEQLLGSHCG
jgi:hypothetical protein